MCHSKDLEQEFYCHFYEIRIIGGEDTSNPPDLNGSSCNDCGSKFKFNLRGKCPSCEGSGEYAYITYRCGIEQRRRTTKCPTCDGTGIIE